MNKNHLWKPTKNQKIKEGFHVLSVSYFYLENNSIYVCMNVEKEEIRNSQRILRIIKSLGEYKSINQIDLPYRLLKQLKEEKSCFIDYQVPDDIVEQFSSNNNDQQFWEYISSFYIRNEIQSIRNLA